MLYESFSHDTMIYKYRNMYHIYLVTRKGWGLVKGGSRGGGRLLFQNNPKYLAPAYMIDLDFGDFLGKLKTPLNPIYSGNLSSYHQINMVNLSYWGISDAKINCIEYWNILKLTTY